MMQTVALIGTYVPRKCGIATFTKDLRDAIASAPGGREVLVLALDDQPEGYPYSEEVRIQINAHQRREYLTAADMLNINQVDMVIVQHEYGIFGGQNGTYVLDLMRRLRMPVITTLHTILAEPTPGQKAAIRELSELSDRLVVMAERAVHMLQDIYGTPAEKIVMIPHGIHDMPFVDPAFYKDQFGQEGRKVLLTFGLLSPGKGIEVALQALPHVIAQHPDVVYVILGATHPEILKREGNAYRHRLEQLTNRLGLRDHVVFHNRYVSLEELRCYLGAADVYITPYPSREQITSGTLAYALGAGKAVVSTPYWYAEELLQNNRGRLFPFGDSEALAAHLNELLADDVARNAMRKRAYLFSRDMVWETVGRRYIQLAEEIRQDRHRQPRPVLYIQGDELREESFPEIDLAHLYRLTDHTGILQHAVYSVPDRAHGYCTDDNARALYAACLYYGLTRDEQVLELANRYMAFLYHAFNASAKRFRNFLSYDRHWLEEVGSEEVHGRALCALGQATALAPNQAMLSFSTRLFGAALKGVETLQAPRALAQVLVGIHAYLRRFGGDTTARRVRAELAARLYQGFANNASDAWPWCEDLVTYDNGKLPHALILSGQWLPDTAIFEQGLRSLEWLLQLQVAEDGTVSLIGNQGWMRRDGERARFDQQPIEIMALIEACAEAYRCTQDKGWRDRARQLLRWFLGNNDTHSMLYDYQTGGSRDGLHADGPNLNEGAESTLAWLISLMTMYHMLEEPTEDVGESRAASPQPVDVTAS